MRKDGTESCHVTLGNSEHFDSHSNEECYSLGKKVTSVCRQAGSLICNKTVGDAHRSAEFLETTISTGVLLAAREFVRRFDWISRIVTGKQIGRASCRERV